MKTQDQVTVTKQVEFTVEQQLAQARAENEELRAAIAAQSKAKDRPLSFKVSEKKALSIYGLGRFPVTLYGNQWLKLIGAVKAIEQFIADNKSRLSMEKPGDHVTASPNGEAA